MEQLVHRWLTDALLAGAADLHFEPFEGGLSVRQRIDGVLHAVALCPVHLKERIVSHIKILAQLDIAQKRQPQDGRMAFKNAQGGVSDLRISTVPTLFGESVMIRFLDKRSWILDLPQLGIPEAIRTELLKIIEAGEGLLLITGPTGSGKTTTLYALLQTLAQKQQKIITLEDPIEYTFDHLIQVAIRPEMGLSFSHALRACLRHDPDVLVIGELRDAESAIIACQAALTGHLVLATLHTRDTASTPLRLVEMGVPNYQVNAVLRGILAQKLLPRPCLACQQVGCPECLHRGYAGRTGQFSFEGRE